jgi:hypothetical protein
LCHTLSIWVEGLQPRIDRLRLKREDGEDRLGLFELEGEILILLGVARLG